MEYRRLEKNEIIQNGDEIDRCVDAWRDDPVWESVHPDSIGDIAPDPKYPAHRQYRRPVCGATARLHNNGCDVRVDLGNTGKNWPNCDNPQRGFPWLSFGMATWQAAEDYARQNGATEIIRTGLRIADCGQRDQYTLL